jgi:hypothetical protein
MREVYMDNLFEDAKDQPRSLRREQKEGERQPDTSYIGGIGYSSGSSENQPERNDRENGQNLSTVEAGGNTSIGKMLEALNLLKMQHLAYVRSHRERMELQLNKNREEELNFLKECELLEEQIKSMILQEQGSQSEDS